jgi:hypothetical protein
VNIVEVKSHNLRELGVTAGVMGHIRYPGRICFVYLDESGDTRFILVPYEEELAVWKHLVDRELSALEGYEMLDVDPIVSQWAARGRD